MNLKESIKTFLDAQSELDFLDKKVYKKPIKKEQTDNYLYFNGSRNKTRIETGHIQPIEFTIVCDSMENLENASNILENLIVGDGRNIDSKLWKVLYVGDFEDPENFIRVINYDFYILF